MELKLPKGLQGHKLFDDLKALAESFDDSITLQSTDNTYKDPVRTYIKSIGGFDEPTLDYFIKRFYALKGLPEVLEFLDDIMGGGNVTYFYEPTSLSPVLQVTISNAITNDPNKYIDNLTNFCFALLYWMKDKSLFEIQTMILLIDVELDPQSIEISHIKYRSFEVVDPNA